MERFPQSEILRVPLEKVVMDIKVISQIYHNYIVIICQ